jgi:hypothetical protein
MSDLLERITDTGHYSVVTNPGEKLSVRKQAAQKFDMQRLHLRKSKNSIKPKSQTGLQLWKTSTIMWTSTDLKSIKHRISKYQ